MGNGERDHPIKKCLCKSFGIAPHIAKVNVAEVGAETTEGGGNIATHGHNGALAETKGCSICALVCRKDSSSGPGCLIVISFTPHWAARARG